MMDQPADVAAPARPSPRQVFLGLFILGQLAFLVLTNGLDFYQTPQPHLPADVGAAIDRVLPGYANKTSQAWTTPEEVAAVLRRWTHVTGQDQRWSLFAPGVFKVTGFPALVLAGTSDSAADVALARTIDLLNRRTDPVPAGAADPLRALRAAELEPPELRAAGQLIALLAARAPLDAAVLASGVRDPSSTAAPLDVDVFLSDNEPVDRRHFARLGKFRLRRFESYLILYLTQRDHETLAEARVRWADAIRDHVGKNADAIQLYLKWRLSAYRERYPDRPAPAQVILVERVFAIRPPDDDAEDRWQGPRTLPIARWQPERDVPKDYRPIERYDPVTKRFENVPK